MKAFGAGQFPPVEETSSAAPERDGPEIGSELDGDVARLTLAGELTEAARRPVIRIMTDLLLGQQALRRVELHLSAVGFMNSGGMAVLVQV